MLRANHVWFDSIYVFKYCMAADIVNMSASHDSPKICVLESVRAVTVLGFKECFHGLVSVSIVVCVFHVAHGFKFAVEAETTTMRVVNIGFVFMSAPLAATLSEQDAPAKPCFVQDVIFGKWYHAEVLTAPKYPPYQAVIVAVGHFTTKPKVPMFPVILDMLYCVHRITPFLCAALPNYSLKSYQLQTCFGEWYI